MMDHPSSAAYRQAEFSARVVVRFTEDIRLSAGSKSGEELEVRGIGPWRELTRKFPGLELTPVFRDPIRRFDSLIERAKHIDPSYRPADFGAFYYVDAPEETDLVALVRALLEWTSVESAYIEVFSPASTA